MVIVEAVAAGSAAAQTGVQVGDRFLSYAGKELSSPSTLLALEENPVDVGQVPLVIERWTQHLEFLVSSGPLGCEVRPPLPDQILVAYGQGREARQEEDYASAAGHFSVAARQSLPKSVEAAWLWGNVGAMWEKVGAWEAGLDAWKASRAAAEGSEDSTVRSTVLIGLGRCCEGRGEWEAASGWYKAAQEWDNSWGRELWGARALYHLGRVATRRGDLKTAHDFLIRAIQIEERIAPHSLDMATSLNNLGTVTFHRGDLQEAQDYFTQALQIRERLAPDSLDVAGSLGNLGTVTFHRGDLQGAQDYFTQALQIQERLAPHSLNLAASLNNLGNIAQDLGDLQGANNYYIRAMEIEERLAPDSLDMAMSLGNLGTVASRFGDLQAALNYYTRALQIQQRLAPHSRDVAMSFISLGNIAQNRGDLQGAQDYYTQALQIYERLAPLSLNVAMCLGNLGNVASRRNDLQAAQDYQTQSLRIKESLAPGSLDVAKSLNSLGIIAFQSHDLDTAQDYFTQGFQIQKRLAPGSIDMAGSLISLSNIAQTRGDLQGAQAYGTQALQIYERLAPHSLECAEALTLLGTTFLQQQQPQLALPMLQQSVQILEQQRAAIVSAEARALLLAQHMAQYAALIQGYLTLNRPADAFATLEHSRARSLLELLTERRLDFTAQAPPHLLQQQYELDRERAHTYDQLAQLTATLEDQAQIEAMHQQVRDLQRRQQELTDQIQQASPRYAALHYPQPLDSEAAQQALDPGTLLLSYFVDEAQTFLFAVTRTIIHAFTLPVGVKALAEQVQRFRQALDLTSLDNDLHEALESGRVLDELLLAPVASQIRRAERLLLCADGPLHILPWPALVRNRGRKPRYLGQCLPLHTTLSMTIYAQARQEGRGKREERQTSAQPTDSSVATGWTIQVLTTARRLLALGDPIYTRSDLTSAFARSATFRPPASLHEAELSAHSEADETAVRPGSDSELTQLYTRGLSLAALPYTREEVEQIGQLFGEGAVVKVGAHATKTAALTESEEVDLVHFACHGWLDARDPLASGLVLSQPEALGAAAVEGDNGLLQAWEIFSKLRLKAELVVLSACQTGLGQEVRGEGLIGLTRAFQYAGAQSVLVSLWEVGDASTSVFMQAFYEQLKVGTAKAEALQHAMAAVRQHPQWDHPFYWAAFTLSGD